MSDTASMAKQLETALDRDEAVGLLRKAVSHESVTGNESAFADFLFERMEDLRLAPERAEFLPGRPNVWGERKGATGGKRLLFIGHTDTVHVRGWKEHWAGTDREDPFGGAIVDGAMWGRGTGDLKAGICTSLAALELLDRAGVSLAGDVAFAFVGDEESGEPGSGVSAGIKDFVGRIKAGDIPKPDFSVYVEPTRLNVYSAHMGFFFAEIDIIGKSAYFGVPEQGVDALKGAHDVLDAVWRHSEDIAARRSHDLVGRAFALVTELASGGYIAVPGEARISLIRKVLPGESLDEAVDELESVVRRAVADKDIRIDIALPAGRDHRYGGEPVEVDPALPEVGLLSRAIGQAAPGRGSLEGAPYWSEASILVNEIGCPTVYCAPGDITNCHTLEERVALDEYARGIVAFALFIASYCGTTQD